MDHEGILIEVDQGRVARVFTNGAPLAAGATVTYDGTDARALPVRKPSHAEEIERFVAAQREGRANTQRHGIRTACETAFKHYQAIAQATGALSKLLSEIARLRDGDPATFLESIKEAANRIDDDILREIRRQLLGSCEAAMELRVGADIDERPPAVPNGVQPAKDASQANDVFYEAPRLVHPR